MDCSAIGTVLGSDCLTKGAKGDKAGDGNSARWDLGAVETTGSTSPLVPSRPHERVLDLSQRQDLQPGNEALVMWDQYP